MKSSTRRKKEEETYISKETETGETAYVGVPKD